MNATAETADLATFTEETLYEKFFFLCSVFSITLHDNLHVLDKEVMYAVKTNETMIFLSLEYFLVQISALVRFAVLVFVLFIAQIMNSSITMKNVLKRFHELPQHFTVSMKKF